jgi:hypothetical protein
MDVDHAAAAAGGGGRDDGGDRDGRGAAAPSPPNKKRPRHDQGDVLASPDENAHRGRTCVLNEKETAAAAAEERLDDASEWATFERVKKNRAACLQFLVGLTQRIERMWVLADQLDAAAAIGAAADSDTQQQHEQQDSGARCKARDARQRVVGRVLLLRRCLEALEDHKESDLREVARLAQKIKESSIPNLSLKHFLGAPPNRSPSSLHYRRSGLSDALVTCGAALFLCRVVSAHRAQVHAGPGRSRVSHPAAG